jgi:hypothetical protein
VVAFQVSVPQVGNVTVGVSTTNKWQSKLIRWVLGSPCSHAWIAYDSYDFGFRRVIQAEWYGFEDIPWTRWKQKNILIAEFFPTGKDVWESVQWLANFLGAAYDFRAAVLTKISRYLRSIIKQPFKDPSKLMCSEAVVRMLQRANYESFLDLDPEGTGPHDCLRVMVKDSLNFQIKYLHETAENWLEKRKIPIVFPASLPVMSKMD